METHVAPLRRDGLLLLSGSRLQGGASSIQAFRQAEAGGGTHLPSALAGAPAAAARPKTEAAGAAEGVGGVEVEGAVHAGVAAEPPHVFLQTR